MRKPVAAALVFFASASVLVLEILAGRLLAPYVGVSLETFTGIIGVVLAGISVGSWLGGKAADAFDPGRLLGPLLIAGGASAVASPFFVDLIGPTIGAGPYSIVILAAVGFFVPAAVLSAVTPTVVKLVLADLDETGRVVGRLSAIGTAGAIFGTFFTGFVLIASLPSRPLVWAIGAVLVVVGAAISFRMGSIIAVGGIVGIAAGTLLIGLGSVAIGSPCDLETAYSCARVEVGETPSQRLLVLDTVRHSFVDLEDPTFLEFRYINIFAAVIDSVAPQPEPLNVLFLGGGGFTLPRYVEFTRPGSTGVVLEIDGALVDLNRDQLGLVLGDGIEAVVGDARVTLVDQPDNAFDVVIGDAYSGLSVPWHLTTREYMEAVKAKLIVDGTFAINVIDQGPAKFLRGALATIAEQYRNVVLIGFPSQLAGDRGGNFIIVASDGAIDERAILLDMDDRGYDLATLSGDALGEFIGTARVLRDDFAPVDQLLTR